MIMSRDDKRGAQKAELHSEQETMELREATLKRMLSTLHKPHRPLGKSATKKQMRKAKPGR